MATEGKKFSQITSGGALNPATDRLVAVRDGNADVLVEVGTAAGKDASDATKDVVASVSGAVVAGHLAVFADASGTLQDGGLPNAATGRKVTAGGDVTLVADDQKILLAKATPATTNVVFDPGSLTPYKTYEVMDGLGNAFSFPFTIKPNTGAINGQPLASVGVNWGSIRFFTDGTDTYFAY